MPTLQRYKKIYAFYFKANLSPEDYFRMHWIEPSSQHDPTPFHTELEIYIPKSASWAMWGERSREIGVIGLDDLALAKLSGLSKALFACRITGAAAKRMLRN